LQGAVVVVATEVVVMAAVGAVVTVLLAQLIHILNNMKLLPALVGLAVVVVAQLITGQFMVMVCREVLVLLLFVTAHLVTPE
jgi:hypothetical protein